MYNFAIAQTFGILGIISSVLSMQMKIRKHILIMLLLLNLCSALNFLFLEGYTSFLICLFAVIEMLINYFCYEKKNKKVPLYVIGIYIIINIILSMFSYKGLIDILPIMCAIIYCITIITKKEFNIRVLMLLNQILWLITDIKYEAYAFSIANVLTIISIFIAMYRYHYKGVKK